PDPCPEPLRRILMKSMAPDPDLRYPSARDFGADLEAFQAGTPVAAMSEDPDATRRTFRPREETDAGDTRRTATHGERDPGEATRRTAGRSFGVVTAPQTKPAARRKPGAFGVTMRVIFFLLLAGVVYGGWVLTSSYLLYQHGQQLAREVEAEQLTDL